MKRIALWLGIAFLVIVVAILSLPFLIDANRFRPMLESELTKSLGRDVKVGDLKLSILSGGVTASDVTIADDPAFSQNAFLETKSQTLGVELVPLIFSRELHITQLIIDQPAVNLIQSPAGDWNFSTLGGRSAAAKAKPSSAPSPGTGLDLSVKLVRITNGRFSLTQLHSSARPNDLANVNVEVQNFSTASAFPFTFSATVGSGGQINVKGTAGPIDSSDAAATPVKVNVKLSQFDLAAARIDRSGALAGLLSLDGSGTYDGRNLDLAGKIRIAQLRISKTGTPTHEPVEFDFTVLHDLRKRAGQLRRGDIHLGTAVARLTGTYQQHSESLDLNLALSGPDMPVPQLEGILPAIGVVLPAGSSLQGGTASAKVASVGPLDALVTTGSLSFNNTRLTGFDLGSKMSTIERLAGIKTGPDTEIQVFAANLRVAPDGTAAQDINFVAPALGTLTGNGTVSPAQALDFKMSATVKTGGVMAVLGPNAKTAIPFTIEGTASHPVFKPDMKAVAGEKVKNVAGEVLGGIFGKKKEAVMVISI